MVKKYPSSIRIFKNPVLESLTHVHPLTPLLLWAPIIFLLFLKGFTLRPIPFLYFIPTIFAGLIVWTLIEYVMHRFLFHYPAKSKWGKNLVFLFHGLHHDDPNDATRLVMPPVPALIYTAILYSFFSLFLKGPWLYIFFASFLCGYLCYDYIHYGTHHFKMKGPIGRKLKRNHLIHHAKDDIKFGVSSPLWDFIFNTFSKKEAARPLSPVN